jgi:hypothetical protein
MYRITLDKIASAAKNVEIGRDVTLSDSIISKEGYLVAVEVLNDKAIYNELENRSGRMMRLKPGDRIAGVLGIRQALQGYSGHVPETLAKGDRLNVLNLGGVLGSCTSHAPNVGRPFEVEVLGAVLHFPHLERRISEPAHIGMNALPEAGPINGTAPIIAVLGTCMNAGKTMAACQIIHEFTRKGLRVGAAKVTGISLERDVLLMRDHGAAEAFSFNDAGLVTTTPETAPGSTRRIIAALNRAETDVIVLEFGDGLVGEYGVQAILSQKDMTARIRATILCANDPVGALGGVPLLQRRFGLKTTVVTGPVTDNDVGRKFIEKDLEVPAANAMMAPAQLAGHVLKAVFANEE